MSHPPSSSLFTYQLCYTHAHTHTPTATKGGKKLPKVYSRGFSYSPHPYVKENFNTTMAHRGCACIPVKHVSFCNFIRTVYIYTYIWTARISWEGQHNTIIHACNKRLVTLVYAVELCRKGCASLATSMLR